MLLVATTVVGAAIAVVLYAVVIPSPPPNHNTLLALKIAVPVYAVVAIAAGSARMTELAKEVDGHVLASSDSVRAAGDEEAGCWKEQDTVTLRGRSTETVLAVPSD